MFNSNYGKFTSNSLFIPSYIFFNNKPFSNIYTSLVNHYSINITFIYDNSTKTQYSYPIDKSNFYSIYTSNLHIVNNSYLFNIL